jgi:hypothetical protein
MPDRPILWLNPDEEEALDAAWARVYPPALAGDWRPHPDEPGVFLRADHADDPAAIEAARHGHGETVAACGHELGGCRCPHRGWIQKRVGRPCPACGGPTND